MAPRHRIDKRPTHIKDLVQDPKNRRAHNPRNIGMVVDALQHVGAARSIVIDEGNVILAGNGVTEAAAEAGITKVRVIDAAGDEIIAVRRSGLTEDQKRALAIYDNRTGELATWNLEQLQEDAANGLDLERFFFDSELKELFGSGQKSGLTNPDAVPQERATGIQRGDLFELGAHRLLCGDCTVQADVARLMGDVKAGLMNTDPPYGIGYTDETRVAADRAHVRPDRQEKWAGGIKNDDQLDGPKLQAFLEASIRTAVPHLIDHAAFYLWHPMLTQGTFFAAAAAADILIHRQIIWVKPALLFGFGDYHWRHELCFYGWRKGFRPEFYGERNQTSVWEITHDTSNGNREHPTQKPVELFLRPIHNHTVVGDAIYEPFAGSGSQIIAAEQTNRKCLAVEIVPACCQVIIDRWEGFTGQQAQKVGELVRV